MVIWAISPEAFARAWAEGRTTLEQVTDEALNMRDEADEQERTSNRAGDSERRGS